MTKYRIVTDEWAGFEVQSWRWWWPFWIEVGGTNTHRTIQAAEEYAKRVAKKNKVVKELGEL